MDLGGLEGEGILGLYWDIQRKKTDGGSERASKGETEIG